MAASTQEQLERQEHEPGELENTLNRTNSLRGLRMKADSLLADFSRKKFATSETVKAYREVVAHDEAQGNAEGLEGFYNWMQKEWNKAQTKLSKIQRQMDAALAANIMSGTDREFLMAHLVLTQEHDFIGEADKIENLLGDKIDRMRKDKDRFSQIRHNPLVSEGVLKTDEKTQLPIPDEAGFLKMTVPERRAFLQQVESALPQAEAYAKKAGGIESVQLGEKYQSLLQEARSQGIFGAKTYDALWSSFQEGSPQGKQEKISNFLSIKSRHVELWRSAKSHLKGNALSEMESMKDALDYTQLLDRLGQYRKNIGAYQSKLEYALNTERIIGSKTMDAFMDSSEGIRSQSLEHQAYYLSQFENQMSDRRKLWGDIRSLKDPEIRNEFESKRHEFGYSELKALFDTKFPNGIPENDQLPTQSRADRILSRINDISKREAVIKAEENLSEMGDNQKIRFMGIVSEMANHTLDDTYKPTQRSGVHLENEKPEEEVTVSNNSKLINFADKLRAKRQTAKENTTVEHTEEQALTQDGFVQEERTQESGQTERVARVEINKEKGLKQLLHEDHENAFKGELKGGKDQVQFYAQDAGGRHVSLNLEEIRAMRKYIQAKEEEKEQAA